jgi:hypothetical protein
MAAGEIGLPGPHAVLLVVVELKAELARAATLHPLMVDYLAKDQALKEPYVTLKHAQVIFFNKNNNYNSSSFLLLLFVINLCSYFCWWLNI